MPAQPATQQQLVAENADLRARLERAEATLNEMLSGEADALFVNGVDGVDGAQLFTVKGADQSYRTLIEEMSEGALTITADGVILYANHSFAGMLKMPLEKVIGSTIQTWVAPESQPGFRALLDKGADESRRAELILIASDRKSLVAAYVSVIRLHLTDMPDGFCMVATDLTEQKRIEQNLVSAKELAETANKAKDSFLATMSHEIRTPLGGMLGMLELLSMTPLDDEQGSTLEAARGSARSLLRIVSDILDWSKIEEGKMQLSVHPTSLHQLLSEVTNAYSRIASAKSLILKQQIDTRLNATYIVDPLRLSQVLNNFVSNATKFTQRGEVELRAELLERIESGDRIRFSVRDTGIGIPEEVQQQLFQRYRQESADTARMYGGTGLGLAICRRLADLMDGQIELVSAEGLGSTFSITMILPVSSAQAESLQSQSLLVKQREIEPLFDDETDAPLVLAVDDNPINRKMIAFQLKLLGLRVEVAENGEVALSMCREGRFALVITDCHMPEMDGYAFTRALRKIESEQKLPRTPVIAWTANALADEAERCHKAGMDTLLVKPTDLRRLKSVLAEWLAVLTS